MRSLKRRSIQIAAIACALALVGAACSDDDSSDTSTDGTGGGGGGAIVISGSSTVEPISSEVAELFTEAGNDVDITVDGPGTGDGFELFCAGETDISDASRPITAEEVANCEDAGIEFIELKVAIDGITVMTNPANEGVECVSFEDLYALIGPEAEGFGNWSDAQELAAELGSTTTFPDASLDITGPGSESGTYDSFIELVLEGIGETRAEEGFIPEDEAATTRTDYTSQSNDNAIIQGITGQRQLARLGGLRLRRGERATRSRSSRSPRAPSSSVWPRPRRRSPTAPTRSRGRSTST